MLNRRTLLASTVVAIPLHSALGNPIAATTLAQRLLKIMKLLGKTSAAIGTSAFAGIVSAKVMKDYEHAHDDAPGLHVIAYYGLVGNRRIDDAASFWVNPPTKHLEFMKTFQSLELQDLKEISKTPKSATVWVTLQGNQIGKPTGIWQGPIQLVWIDKYWLIQSMEIRPRDAAY